MRVNIGFVGCGFMSQNVHIPSFIKCRNCEVVAVADLRYGLAKAVAKRWRVSKVYPSASELIEDEAIDAVAVITNKFVHAPIALDAISKGKHVFVEKPIATTSNDAKVMVEAAERSDVKLMVGYMKRHDTGIQLAKTIFDRLREDDGITYARSHLFGGDWVCGAPFMDTIQSDEKNPDIKAVWPDFLPDELYPTMNWLLEQIHDVNLPRFFLGEPVSVRSFEMWPKSFVGMWNYQQYPLLLEMGQISADFWDEQLMIYLANHWLDVRPPPPLLRNVPAKIRLYYAGKTQRDEVPHGKWEWSFERQAQHFIDCVAEDREPISSGEDSYRDILILEAMLRSKMENKEVRLQF